MTQIDALSLPKLQEDIHTALKLWHSKTSEVSPLGYLHLFQQAQRRRPLTARHATNLFLNELLETMEEEYSLEVRLLRMRFQDGMAMHIVANRLNLAESTANKKQRQAIERLAGLLYAQEQRARATSQSWLERRLDLPPLSHLVGAQTHLNHLQDWLLAPAEPWLVSIEGLGGIGKTALANSLIREIALTHRFEGLAWVSARQQDFRPAVGLHPTGKPALDETTLVELLLAQLDPQASLARSPQEKWLALTDYLKKQPCLVVIDNLETVMDYQTLLPSLRKLARPGKFLLTSRYSLQTDDVAALPLTELGRDDTLALLRYEAQARCLTDLAQATAAQLADIYEVVGGNPLALKLVIGQTCILSLPQVLENLRQARGKKIEELYTHIYWQDWHALDPTGRQLLLAMPLVQNGTVEQLAAVSELDLAELTTALDQLVGFSLLEVGGQLEQRRYRIHRLTETFLVTEVAKWQSSP